LIKVDVKVDVKVDRCRQLAQLSKLAL